MIPLPFRRGTRDARPAARGWGLTGRIGLSPVPHPRAGCAVSRPSPKGEG